MPSSMHQWVGILCAYDVLSFNIIHHYCMRIPGAILANDRVIIIIIEVVCSHTF